MQYVKVVEVWRDKDLRAYHALRTKAERVLMKHRGIVGILAINKRGTMLRLFDSAGNMDCHWAEKPIDAKAIETRFETMGITMKLNRLSNKWLEKKG
jgi:hypothetical protein